MKSSAFISCYYTGETIIIYLIVTYENLNVFLETYRKNLSHVFWLGNGLLIENSTRKRQNIDKFNRKIKYLGTLCRVTQASLNEIGKN